MRNAKGNTTEEGKLRGQYGCQIYTPTHTLRIKVVVLSRFTGINQVSVRVCGGHTVT